MFGEKVFKVPLNAGFNCPNRDGTIGSGGCIFCSPHGSGDFAGNPALSLAEQFQQVRAQLHRKWPHAKYIGYFQAYTNTYAPVSELRTAYETILCEDGVVGLAVATRPDCLPPAVLDLLAELNDRTYLWVELGLQTIHAETARLINRGYDLACFLQALSALQSRKIRTCVHLILGLPGESRAEMLATAHYIAGMPIQGIKLHLLHVLQDTPLCEMFARGQVQLLTQEDYVQMVVDILEILPPTVIIHRVSGDGPRETLVGPLWCRRKKEVLAAIDAELRKRGTWQGKYWYNCHHY